MSDKIIKDNKLNDIITKYPATRDVFIKHGMPKYTGRLPSENLEFFCRMHRVDINQLLDELNKVVGVA
ncbi:MAG: DUF1858 domain-containing protein [Candidatus Methanoperedens sp.]|nr:DUF1858 domain-containing protein [Candidatus Methanoperedens sp.]MCE8429886.1 DUF1858 domain-containing protein [Candidatus Methanoperedens sp.]